MRPSIAAPSGQRCHAGTNAPAQSGGINPGRRGLGEKAASRLLFAFDYFFDQSGRHPKHRQIKRSVQIKIVPPEQEGHEIGVNGGFCQQREFLQPRLHGRVVKQSMSIDMLGPSLRQP